MADCSLKPEALLFFLPGSINEVDDQRGDRQDEDQTDLEMEIMYLDFALLNSLSLHRISFAVMSSITSESFIFLPVL
jgi:hypothetical protein